MSLSRSTKILLIIAVIVIAIIAIVFLVKISIRILINNELRKYRLLEQEDLSSVPDEELIHAAVSWMWSKFDSDWANEYEIISSLPEPCQNIYSVYIIEAEVNNGGFNQCYFNSSNQFTQMAETGFAAMGAEGFADIMARANIIYSEIKDDLEKYNDGTIESFSESYEENPLNALDDEFINMYEKEPLDKLCIDYIRANSQYFGN